MYSTEMDRNSRLLDIQAQEMVNLVESPSALTTLIVAADHCVKKFSPEGGELQFDKREAIAFNSTNNKICVCDTFNHQIQILNSDLTFFSTFGTGGYAPGEFCNPEGIAIADRLNHRVQVFSPSHQFLKQQEHGMGGLTGPTSVCIDSKNFLYVLEVCYSHSLF